MKYVLFLRRKTNFKEMKKVIFVFGLFLSAGWMTSCGGDGHEETAEGTDSTAVVEEESDIAFNGTEAGDYLLYGHTEFDGSNAVSTDSMLALVAANGGFEGEVSVTIAEVCQQAGCWITFNNPNGESIRVFFRDHFTIPTETAGGTEAILLGTTQVDTLDVEFQKHLLDDAKKAGEEITDADYASITGDKIETTFDCESILVKK